MNQETSDFPKKYLLTERFQFLWMLTCAFLSFIIVVAACSPTKSMTAEKPEERIQPLISFRKSPCFGKCQVYMITVYKDGLAILEGTDNIDKTGVSFAQVPAADLDKLKKDLSALSWKEYKASYFKNIPDLPSTELKFYHKSDSAQTVRSNTTLPAELEALQKSMAGFTEKLVWTNVMKKHEVNSPNNLYGEIQVDMDSSLTPAMLETRFLPYGLKVKNRISPYMNFWLFTYDESAIKPFEMLIVIRKVHGVRLAMFNKKLDARED
jgi:hypothetical protein